MSPFQYLREKLGPGIMGTGAKVGVIGNIVPQQQQQQQYNLAVAVGKGGGNNKEVGKIKKEDSTNTRKTEKTDDTGDGGKQHK